MTIIHCAECKNKISDTASSCPHCGARPKAGTFNKVFKLFFFIAIICVLGIFTYSASMPEYKKQALSRKNACLTVAKELQKPEMATLCNENYKSELFKGEMLEPSYQSNTLTRQTSEEEKNGLIDEYKIDCIKRKTEILTPIRKVKRIELSPIEKNKIERCAELTGDPDFITAHQSILKMQK